MECLKKISCIVTSIVITFMIVGIITLLWQQLELVYLGYVNDNPVDTIITILYSLFVYLCVYRWLGDE